MNQEYAFVKAEFISAGESDEHDFVLFARGESFDAAIVASVSITGANVPATRVDICASSGESCFQSTRASGGIAYIGFGHFVFVIDVYLQQVQRHELSGYFGHLYGSDDLEPGDDQIYVLATSASEVLAFGRTGELIWKQSNLGVDGVVLHSASAGRINGAGDWDPPEGWQPFSLDAKTGAVVE